MSAASTRRRPRPRVLVPLALAFLAVSLEVVARLMEPELPVRFDEEIETLMGAGQGGFASYLLPDHDRFWRLAPDVVLDEVSGRYGGRVSNSQGFREDETIMVPKPAGEYRVFFLGSSPTYGTGVLREECFVEVAERALGERFPGERIQCVNAGVPGYSLFQGWRLLETEGRGLESDLLVVQFGAMGIQGWGAFGDLTHWEYAQASKPPGLLAHSRFLRLIWSRRAREVLEQHRIEPDSSTGEGGEPPARPRLELSEFRMLLRRIEGIAKDEGMKLLFLVSPSRTHVMRTEGEKMTPLHYALVKFATKRGYPVLNLGDVLEPLAREEKASAAFLDAWHPTAAGHARMGEAVAAEIARLRAGG